MLRLIGSVIIGFVVMVVCVIISHMAFYLFMGTERSFQEGSWDASILWSGASLGLGLVCAIIGGVVCALIAKPRSVAPGVLAGIVLILGLVTAVGNQMVEREAPPERTADVESFEAMTYAKSPVWYEYANPFVGLAGVLVGSGLVAGREGKKGKKKRS